VTLPIRFRIGAFDQLPEGRSCCQSHSTDRVELGKGGALGHSWSLYEGPSHPLALWRRLNRRSGERDSFATGHRTGSSRVLSPGTASQRDQIRVTPTGSNKLKCISQPLTGASHPDGLRMVLITSENGSHSQLRMVLTWTGARLGHSPECRETRLESRLSRVSTVKRRSTNLLVHTIDRHHRLESSRCPRPILNSCSYQQYSSPRT